MKDLTKEVAERTGFGELIIDGAISLGICTPVNEPRLKQWADAHSCKINVLSGPPVDSNEFRRMKDKIFYEQKQLPKDKPNLVVIHSSDFFYPVKDVVHAMNILEESVFDYDHVFAVVIHGGFIGPSKSFSVRQGSHLFVEKLREGMRVDQDLLLWNRFCKIPVSSSSGTKIYNTLNELGFVRSVKPGGTFVKKL